MHWLIPIVSISFILIGCIILWVVRLLADTADLPVEEILEPPTDILKGIDKGAD